MWLLVGGLGASPRGPLRGAVGAYSQQSSWLPQRELAKRDQNRSRSVFNDRVFEVTPSFPLILLVRTESLSLAYTQGERIWFPPLKMPVRVAHIESAVC